MKAHLAGDAAIEPHAFIKATLAEIGMPPQIVMRHRLPHFGHIFSGDGYSAGDYDSIWADTLTADAAEAFRRFRGREVTIDALMRDRGFPAPEKVYG